MLVSALDILFDQLELIIHGLTLLAASIVCYDITGGSFEGGKWDSPETGDILKYDPDTETWTKTGAMSVTRAGHTLSPVRWGDYEGYCV